MKNIIILLLTIFFFGCKNNSKQLESLEIMSYYYLPNEDQNRFEISALIYIVSDEVGNASVMKMNEPMSKKYSFFKTKIDTELIQMLQEI